MAYLAPNFEAISNEVYCTVLVPLQQCGIVCQVFDYPPLALSGKTPIVTMHNDGTVKNDYRQSWTVNYRITIFINRQVEGSDEAERQLERVKNAFHRLMAANRQGTTYSALHETVGVRSVPLFQVIDGQPYRQEEIPIAAHVEFCDIPRPYIDIGGGAWLLASDCALVSYTDVIEDCTPCEEPATPILAPIVTNAAGNKISLGNCKIAVYTKQYLVAANDTGTIISYGTDEQLVAYKG